MSWTAIVPLKAAPLRKSRLAATLPAAERLSLSEEMLAHVENVLGEVGTIGEAFLLAPPGPCEWRGRRILDHGRGLNVELGAAREAMGRADVLIINPDLPLLSRHDLLELLDLAAEKGLAVAPDRHGTGTNAVAVRADQPLVPVFGRNSARLFAGQCPGAGILQLRGLAVDVDTPADLDFARREGAACGGLMLAGMTKQR